MDNDYWEIRDRNWGVLSKKEQHTLKGSSAIVIGLGCVGELEAVMLARIGIGNLTIVDFDTLKKVNLNRNPFSTQSLLNRKKTKNIQELIADIDPTIKTTVINKEITFGCEDLLNKGDVILQAVDDMKSRIIIHRMVENTLNIPIVTMSGGPPNRSFVAVFDHKTDILYEDFLKLNTSQFPDDFIQSDEFSREIRRKKCKRAEYSSQWGAVKEWKEKYVSGERPIWAVTTIRPYLTAVISVNEVVKILLKKNNSVIVPNYYSLNLERIDSPIKLCSGNFNYFEY